MSVKRTERGTWQVRWRDIDGRQRAKTFKTKSAAAAQERNVRTDTERGLPTAPARSMSLGTWAQQWLAGAHNLAPKTRQLYGEVVARLGPLEDVTLARLTPAAIDEWLAARAAAGAAPSSVHRDYRTLRRMLRVAHQRGHLMSNPIDQVAAPRVPGTEMRFLSADELESLAGAIDGRYRTLVLVAGWGGLRWGEAAGLNVARVDTKGERVHVVDQLSPDGRRRSAPKTAAGRRWVTLPQTVAEELAGHVKGRPASAPVWSMPDGGPLVHTRWRGTAGRRAKDDGPWVVHPRGYWCRAVEAAGLAPLRFHDLRHTMVALCIAAGMHPRAIQERLGHASIETTLGTYGHLIEGIAAAADLDTLRRSARRLRAV
jgi:integrase